MIAALSLRPFYLRALPVRHSGPRRRCLRCSQSRRAASRASSKGVDLAGYGGGQPGVERRRLAHAQRESASHADAAPHGARWATRTARFTDGSHTCPAVASFSSIDTAKEHDRPAHCHAHEP